ncbi:uncharacterized protein LTHEOB_6736 [Lasiodiplodia theobromae]|uniref:uncharacterized protein n=1 Tax=Lasiodiplodia theobromae TaxID=45133 RepID=UPI0015C38B06|nr:uncharacterized protein LTHEOB_6736 [Lasiodiplodia theobromae]KAF4544070.1 hypothetical protein LTHEOB_6736 [Lasiodiplodia theobromae]
MRLLHCEKTSPQQPINISFSFCGDATQARYAILSHRWGNPKDEVLFADFKDGTAASKKAYPKIHGCCTKALEDGISQVWVDTCCIDHDSSAELSEISAMYSYYASASVCYAYLEDVESGEDPNAQDSSFRKSLWFTRGWTLQELIAPPTVVFFAKDWVEIGTKASLADTVESITGIERKFFLGTPPFSASISKRMSWAARRETSRTEDRAYCIMGLFNVFMPIMYGERENAFLRLQQEILKKSTDHTIFAWDYETSNYSGMLATDPSQFRNGWKFEAIKWMDLVDLHPRQKSREEEFKRPRSNFELTNNGLRIWLPTKSDVKIAKTNTPVRRVALGCRDVSRPDEKCVTMYLVRWKGDQYMRVSPSVGLDGQRLSANIDKEVTLNEFFLIDRYPLDENVGANTQDIVPILTMEYRQLDGFAVADYFPENAWLPNEGLDSISLSFSDTNDSFGTLQLSNDATKDVIVMHVGFSDGKPWAALGVSHMSNFQAAAELHQAFPAKNHVPETDWIRRKLPGAQKDVMLSMRHFNGESIMKGKLRIL